MVLYLLHLQQYVFVSQNNYLRSLMLMKDSIRLDKLYEIGNIYRYVNVSMNKIFKKYKIELSYEKWSVMICLWDTNGLSQSEIAKVSCRDRSSLARIIDTMEKDNLLIRIPDQVDKRCNRIFLTNKGRELKFVIRNLLLYNPSNEDIQNLARDIRTLNDNLVASATKGEKNDL